MAMWADGKYTMIGGDLSNHNYGKVNPSYWDFAILKASEGKTYSDACLNRYLTDMANEVPDAVPFLGFYHYARPENNTANDEVNNYIRAIRPHIGNCFCALDVEGEALKVKNLDAWCLQWCMEVQDVTGTKPLLYMAAANVHLCSETLKRFPLWVAHYGVQKPKSKRVAINPIMWQFTNKPFDLDIFYGTPADMISLIRGEIKC